MAKEVRPVHHADRRRDVLMPYAPALLVRRGSLLFLSGVTAAPVYHSHPHREEEFDLPRTMRTQDDLNRVWAECLRGHLPTTTTVEVSRLATHPNCGVEISAIAVADFTPRAKPRERRKGARS